MLSKEWVVQHIPFYDGDAVRNIIGGTLRGRGSRTGFDNPIAPSGYKYGPYALATSLPKHLSTEFTLYTNGHRGSRPKEYTDFVCINRKGKVVIRLRYKQ